MPAACRPELPGASRRGKRTRRYGTGDLELGNADVRLPRRPDVPLSHLSLHSTGIVAVIAVISVIGMRLVLKTAKLGLLLAAPALMYLLHQR